MKINANLFKPSGRYCFICLLCFFTAGMGQDESFNVLSGWIKYSDASNGLYQLIRMQAEELIARQKASIAGITSEQGWRERQEQVRKILFETVGPFPEKTPLNVRQVGNIEKENFRVEKIIYESMPGYFVSACVFLPKHRKKPLPAIIYCSGHNALSFRNAVYQKVILNLVLKGFIVLAFDPVGQGERMQYLNPETGESLLGGPTREHSYAGSQCFLTGYSIARYFIWDGIRAVDYLLSRAEVDPNRIGITGRSGGGTQSAYIAAFDNRILAAAPECYITSFERLLSTRGPQDAEQNIFHGIARGIDHADLLQVRAPKPVLMITTTRDIFSIQGARETASDVRRMYEALGKVENFEMVEDDAGHESTLNNRLALYRFFQKHLNLPGEANEPYVELFDPAALNVSDSGQILTSIGGETVFSINKRESESLRRRLIKNRANISEHIIKVKQNAAQLAGYAVSMKKEKAVLAGRYQRQEYSIEKYLLPGEGPCVIPFLLLLPEAESTHPAVVYLHPSGKSTEISTGGELEQLVKNGYAVVTPDLSGIGEVGPGAYKGDSYNIKGSRVYLNIWFGAIQIARSIVGIQSGEVIRLIEFIKDRKDIRQDSIFAVARNELCPVLLHSAVFETAIKKTALIAPLISYHSIVMNRDYKPETIMSGIPGSLAAYDLPDLAAALAPRPLLMCNTVDQAGEPVNDLNLENEWGFVRDRFQQLNKPESFQICKADSAIIMQRVLTFFNPN